MSHLLIPIAKLEESPQRFHLEADAEWWDRARAQLRELESPLLRAFELDVQGHRLGARLLFRGEIRGEVELSCSRCLESFPFAVREPLQLLLEPAPPHVVPEGGIELDPDDSEVGRYGGDELDFDALVVEILTLVWPMQPHCREDCRGLCPGCGTNRNREACRCEQKRSGRPFEALREMIERSKKG